MIREIFAGVVIDGRNIIKNCKLVIKENKIAEIRKNLNIDKEIGLSKEKKIDLINAKNFTVIPGLIDTHVHLTMNPEIMDWPKWAEEKRDIQLLNAAKNVTKLLINGITTARDCGALSDLAFILRDAVEKKILKGPRLHICGNPITITGGHCHFMGIEADNELEIRKAVRYLNKKNVDFIKFMPTGGKLTPESDMFGIQYNLKEIKVLVNEAHQRGKKVHAHALTTQGIKDSARAGVDTIAHCTFFDHNGKVDFNEKAVEEIVKKNIYVEPTLPATALLPRRSIYERESIIKARSDLLKKLVNMGVKLIAGTDAGVPKVDFNNISTSIKLIADLAGLSNIEAISTATVNSADALGLGDKIGLLNEGYIADIIVLKGNPIEDLKSLDNVVMVLKEGEIIYFNKSLFY